MTPPPRGLLDTSVFIELESARPVDTQALPEESVVCPITIAELQAGVLAATDLDTRARRLATLEALADVEVLPIDADVAAAWAHLRVHLHQQRRRVNVNANDLWVAATAITNDLPVVTQDDDFDPLAGVLDLTVIHV